MDIADKAAEYQQQLNDAALAQRNRRKTTEVNTRYCVDCDIEIPEARRAIAGVTRCIKCQTDLESRPWN